MIAMRCRYENEMIRALQTGALSESLMEHQKGCAACRDAMVVAQVLRRDAGEVAARHTLPPPVQVWAASSRHRRMAALQRAARFVFALKIAGLIYAAVLVLWGVRALVAQVGLLVKSGSLNAAIGEQGCAFVGGRLCCAAADERVTG